MTKRHWGSTSKAGLPPGTLVHTGIKHAEAVKISLIDYVRDHVEEKTVTSVDECAEYLTKDSVTWINIYGLHQVEVIEAIGHQLGLHPLVLEDILHTHQRPKLEDYEEYLYIVAKMLTLPDPADGVAVEQLSVILGDGFVVSFQEKEGDIFDSVRDRIRAGKGRIRKMGADYLAYTLMDKVVDTYFQILESLGERIEDLEDELIDNPDNRHSREIHRMKRQMITLRKSLWPLREVINGMERGDTPLIRKETRTFLRDVYDHTIQVIDTVETFRDMVSGLLDLYLSSMSNRMNEVMKVLTIIATIFIPLTFLAGIYGMNFQHMPELGWKYSYFLLLGVMAIVAAFMLRAFRKKGWL